MIFHHIFWWLRCFLERERRGGGGRGREKARNR